MFGTAPSRKIFAYAKPTDMRKSFHGLLALVQRVFPGQDPHSGSLFVFVNRRGNYTKILAWDRDGLAIWYKRLEAGTFQMPASEDSSLEIDHTQLSLLLSGVDLTSARRRKRFKLP